MHSLFRNSPSLPAIVQWLFDLATWLIARSLQMPEPLLQSAGVFVFARAQAFEDSLANRCVRFASSAGPSRASVRRLGLPALLADASVRSRDAQCGAGASRCRPAHTRYAGRRIAVAGGTVIFFTTAPCRGAAAWSAEETIALARQKGLRPVLNAPTLETLPKIARSV